MGDYVFIDSDGEAKVRVKGELTAPGGSNPATEDKQNDILSELQTVVADLGTVVTELGNVQSALLDILNALGGLVPGAVATHAVTIPASADLSDAADLADGTLAAIIMPSAWDAADLSFQASGDGNTFVDLYDEQAQEVTVNADVNMYIRLAPIEWEGIRHIKVRSGTSSVPVAQTDDREIILVTRKI